MVEFGLCYSYVASGEALVLLYFDPADVRTLYYHLAVPHEEVGTGAKENVQAYSSVAGVYYGVSRIGLTCFEPEVEGLCGQRLRTMANCVRRDTSSSCEQPRGEIGETEEGPTATPAERRR